MKDPTLLSMIGLWDWDLISSTPPLAQKLSIPNTGYPFLRYQIQCHYQVWGPFGVKPTLSLVCVFHSSYKSFFLSFLGQSFSVIISKLYHVQLLMFISPQRSCFDFATLPLGGRRFADIRRWSLGRNVCGGDMTLIMALDLINPSNMTSILFYMNMIKLPKSWQTKSFWEDIVLGNRSVK